jgi:hypothetical protein
MRRYSLTKQAKFTDGSLSFYMTTYQTNRKLLDEIRKVSTYYEVQAGDRIEMIAKMFLGSESEWSAIAILNDMINPWDDVRAGVRLFIPPSVDAVANLISYWQKGENNVHQITSKIRS